MSARYNDRRRSRGARAVQIYGLWMNESELKANIKEFGDDPELKKLCETGLECYKQRKDLFEEN